MKSLPVSQMTGSHRDLYRTHWWGETELVGRVAESAFPAVLPGLNRKVAQHITEAHEPGECFRHHPEYVPHG